MNIQLEKYLDKFEKIIDPERQGRIEDICRKTFNFQKVNELPFIYENTDMARDRDWPEFPYNDTFTDPEKMLLDQLREPFLHYQLKDYHPVNIRCNYGTVILPSVFGTPYKLTEYSLPWANHLEGRENIESLLEKGIPDIFNGLGKKVFETAGFYKEILKNYPKLKKAVKIYHPDLQGPLDVAHLIWGHDIFMAMYDCPDIVHRLLKLITDTYLVFMRKWKKLIGEWDELSAHWCFYMKGEILLRNDSAVLISRGHYEEYSKQYDQVILNEFSGGNHYCGCGNTFIESMCEIKNLLSIHCGQPELNDINLLVKSAGANNLVLLEFPEKHSLKKLDTGVFLKKSV